MTTPQPHEPPHALSAGTLAVHAGRPDRRPGAAVNVPVTLSSTFVAGAAVGPDLVEQPGTATYGRWDNGTWEAFEAALGELEGGRALLFASGMAAIAAVLAQVPYGGRVVLPRHAYSGTLGLAARLARAGVLKAEPVDVDDTAGVLAALPGSDLLWVETPTNPMIEVADLPALARAAHEQGQVVVVDNTFATPLLLRPLDLGADVVVHSVTKYLSGHSDVVLGAVVTRDEATFTALLEHRTMHGAIPGPQEAWLALRGLRTLHLRVERAGANAAELARRLAAHPAVRRVRHPSLEQDPGHARAAAQMRGFGAILAVEVEDGATAERVAQGVRLWLHATSLGGVESSLERRRRHSVESPTVPDGLLRLSVGIEDVEDLWADLAQAIDAATR